jgi:predicted dehydrogenase/aryl-alcohol dehydrogenase-like predicted oxidoreductase
MSNKLRWGILSTGRIAGVFAAGVKESLQGELVAVGSRSLASAQKFAAEHGIPNCHGSYEDLFADSEVDAVYIATPHPMHAQWAIRAAEAGKHVLCEKPLALNHGQAMAIVEAAREHGVFLMEAFMYRCHPQTSKLVELIKDGAIGEVKMIQAAFSFNAPLNDESRLGRVYNNQLGGGGILDMGCYPISICRLVAGAALGRAFADPTDVHGAGHVCDTGVDIYAAALLRFEGDIVAQVTTAVGLSRQYRALQVFGSSGSIMVPTPYTPSHHGGTVELHLNSGGKEHVIEVTTDRHLYSFEADMVADSLPHQQATAPAMTWDDTLGNMKVLDKWRAELGVVYEDETPARFNAPVHGRGLSKRASNVMQYGRIGGLDKDVSRLIMGCDNQETFTHAAIMFDDWYERGGNAFDTAYIYGSGKQERLLGQWIKSRGVRDEVAVIVKGGHTPDCNPKAITAQLHESLDRLQLDSADIYLMHRDNADIPVEDFVDCLDAHVQAGRIRAFGGSNWPLARVAAANAYAKRSGKAGFSLVCNNFALARLQAPVWHGCIAASDSDSRTWLQREQLALLSWSSQARGFFTARSGPDMHADSELERCWYSSENFQRKARAVALAQRKGVLPIAIAAAYVLHQAFPTFALIGPRNLYELHTSLEALPVELTDEEVDWLDLRN